jgi:two-component system, LytTR family, sensor histidine kinase AlgZ
MTRVLRSPTPVKRAGRIVAFNTLSAGLYALLIGLHSGWITLFYTFLTAFIYASVIGTAAHFVLPGVCQRLDGYSPVVFWLTVGGTLAGLAVTGSLVAGGLAAALGLYGRGPVWTAIRMGVGVSIVLALSVGLVNTLYSRTRTRLDDARERLRARELEMERAQRLATDARLASLESRLHPHFLFNAIAAIAGQVREEPEHAERLLIEFADLLRASLDSTRRHTVPLGDELHIVRAYLEIEHARLGERLRAKLAVPEEFWTWPVPPFALHTLVQNSVKHVAASRPQGAEVRVEARRVGERLAVSVWDDGPGFDPKVAPPGHGLDTLRAQLAVLFGPDATLDAVREEGGASVVMRLPAHAAIPEQEMTAPASR